MDGLRMRTCFSSAVLVLIGAATGLLTGCKEMKKQEEPPAARVENVKETIQGVEVDDPYRWLENWSDPEVKRWSDAQNEYTRKYLDGLPFRAEIHARIEEIMKAAVSRYSALDWTAGRLFAVKLQPPLNQPLLVVRSSIEDPKSEQVVVDPNALDPDGGTSIDWYVPSPDGARVAVSLSRGGSESGDVHVFETATGRQAGEVVERVNGGTAGGDLAWLPDGSAFYYTRYPRAGERDEKDLNFYQQVWLHKLDDAGKGDRYVIGKDFPRIAEIELRADSRSGRLLVQVQYGDSGRFMHFLCEPGRAPKQISTFDDGVDAVVFGRHDDLFLLSRHDAPNGKTLRLRVKDPVLSKATTVIPEGEQSIVYSFGSKSSMAVTENDLWLVYQLGGPSEVRVFDFSGKRLAGPDAEPVTGAGGLTALDGDGALLQISSYTKPSAWYRFDAGRAALAEAALGDPYPFRFPSDVEAVREYAKSKDGTRVPVNIIRRKGIPLDGSHPVLLTGYGGFSISRTPRFSPLNLVWIEQGGVFAEANLRGGSEFGEAWHRAGMLTRKQNVFDDFAAAIEHMIDAGYTKPDKLAILGGSNGGLLMGAMITQRPDLFRATVSEVGIYDMLRSELTSNGQFNIPEYGSVKDPEQFRAMLAYSPYHNVKDGTAYPSVLLMTGANDPRVDTMHSRKMTARLQAATSSEAPILLRTSSTTGHGFGTPLEEMVAEETDLYSFLFHELGIRYEPVR